MINLVVLAILGASTGSIAFAQSEKVPPPTVTSQGQAEPAKSPKKVGDRWLVKTASDADATKIKQTAIKSTIEKLLAIPRPEELPLYETPAKFQDKRVEGVETSIYTVEAEIVEYRLMPDGDYRVVVRGGSGETMVLEMPDPSPEFVSPTSPFAYGIKNARQQFSEKFQPEKTTKSGAGYLTITGIGYFGKSYGPKRDVKGNLVQLHPVLDIQWINKPSKEFLETPRKAEPVIKPDEPKQPQKPVVNPQ